MVTLEDLATAVRRMRKSQKDYFARRGNSLLNQAKADEAIVDKMLNELAPSGVKKPEQINLFG